MHDLSRFTIAQDADDAGFEQALREIRSGRKRGHWIWYVFPQLAGLGTSSMSQMYAIANSAEAADYLRDPILGPRLLEITIAVSDKLREGVNLSRRSWARPSTRRSWCRR
jgi:uncharacterized protein (DUF1810 family)